MDRLSFEKNQWSRGIDLIAGVDEVGRGALAGPMVVGAVILDKNALLRVDNLLTNNDISINNTDNKNYLNIKDSKLLSSKKRGELAEFIKRECISWAVVEISSMEIDTLHISACTQKGFAKAINSLSVKPEHILTDAYQILEFPSHIQTNITRGDNLSISIAAASIVAKVYRDSLMVKLAEQKEYSYYEFDKHKGYGTKRHFECINLYGVSDIHRKSFLA